LGKKGLKGFPLDFRKGEGNFPLKGKGKKTFQGNFEEGRGFQTKGALFGKKKLLQIKGLRNLL